MKGFCGGVLGGVAVVAGVVVLSVYTVVSAVEAEHRAWLRSPGVSL
ncbi:hypothetical protein [Demequina lutea]|uniref:Uncharacterized protein n=1 Tax=Demequina lutea TaxID=431489 RepID=A0A7Y9ZAV4_9MICO|nr:hypothetical protein [Demequina lutea]NYI41420.1 hypothetical protein [Demequina lutea]